MDEKYAQKLSVITETMESIIWKHFTQVFGVPKSSGYCGLQCVVPVVSAEPRLPGSVLTVGVSERRLSSAPHLVFIGRTLLLLDLQTQ